MAIDFHAYFQPAAFLDRLRQRHGYPRIERMDGREIVWSAPNVGRPLRPEQNDVVRRLAMMDEAGIDTQILRLQNVSGIDALETDEAREVAHAANAELADLARQYPQRFVPYASVPMRDIDKAIEVLDRAVTGLGHRGVGVSAATAGVFVDDPSVAPFLDRVEALGVPLLLLPNHPSSIDSALAPHGWLTGALGFQVDIAVAALRLLCSGALERRPGLRVILANLGGVLPFVTERLDQYWHRVHAGTRDLPVPPVEALRRFYYETASGDARAIRLAAEVIGIDRLVFGSDYPSFDMARAVHNVRDSGLSEDAVEQVLRGNAQPLI
jgi:predicted TIM-barrel fold metal-dependent hydrolase